MAEERAIIKEARNGILWLTLNRPEARNALSPSMISALEEAIRRAEHEDVRCIVITGAGPVFCAGADLQSVKRELASSEDGLKTFLDRASSMLDAIERTSKPVIAAVNGAALAGGFEIVLACDLVIAAQSARFGDAHINVGLLPGGGGSVRLPQKIGVNRAKYMLYSGKTVQASEFVACGFVHEVVADGELPAAAEKLAAAIGGKSQAVLGRMKRLVEAGQNLSKSMALQFELLACEAHSTSREMKEGLAAFAEKRRPAASAATS